MAKKKDFGNAGYDPTVQAESESREPAIPQLPTRLDLYTAAALTGILAHNTSLAPTLRNEKYWKQCRDLAREIGRMMIENESSTEPQTSKPNPTES